MGIHVFPPEPSSLLPPCTIPLGRPSAPARSIQHRALNLDWYLVSYMTFHMFQCKASILFGRNRECGQGTKNSYRKEKAAPKGMRY